ncbi:hypothetical protein [Desulfoluna spongiiphila]|nr:hypothetical protein [Desulfoluna spongiiphila]
MAVTRIKGPDNDPLARAVTDRAPPRAPTGSFFMGSPTAGQACYLA